MGATSALPKAVVVVADDDSSTRQQISTLLRARGATVVSTHSGQKAIDAVRAQPVDLVLLDVEMPGLRGIDACRVIKTITKDRFVPVVLLTAPGDERARVQGARTGADDHVEKPFGDAELLARVENMLRIKRTYDDVQLAKKEIRYTSLHDQLRALPDHRYFHERLAKEFEDAQKHLDPLACCILALDDFKRLVSERGPDVAGGVLREASSRIQRTIRATDVAARFRTAEFGLILPNTRPARALMLADRLVAALALHPFDLGIGSLEITVAVGVGLYPSGQVRSHSELLDASSIAVARARVAGPNRVCVVQQQGYVFRPTLPGAA